MKIQNAKILSTELGFDDMSNLTFNIHFKLQTGGQIGMKPYCIGYGGCCEYYKIDTVKGTEKGMTAIARILSVVGVDKWENLPGTLCRVRFENDGDLNDSLESIGNILKESWFDFIDYFEKK